MPSTTKRLRTFVVAVSALLFVAQVIAFAFGLPEAISGRADFQRFYTAGYMVRVGHARDLYNYESNRRFENGLVSRDDVTGIFDAPAYEALLFVPLSLLTYGTAYIAFFAANLALLVLSIRTLRPYLENLEKAWRWLPAAAFVCFFPVAAALIQGQDSIVLLTLTLASAVAFYRGRDVSAGVFLGLTLFKFQFAVPIALLFLFWRRWRMLAGFAATGAAVALVSLLLAGVDGLRACTHDLPSWGKPLPLVAEWLKDGIHASAMPNLRCLFHGLAGPPMSSGKVEIAAAGCSVLLLFWAATRTANFALAILVALLVSPRGMIYDAVLLVIPITMVLDARIAVSTGTSRRWSRNIASMLFVAPSLLFLSGVSYCLLAPLMLALLMPLRFTRSDSLPKWLVGRPALLVHSLLWCI